MSEPMPPALAAALASIRAKLTALSRRAQLGLALAVVALLAVTIFVGMRVSHETYAPLFTQLERDDSAALVAKLKELKVPYRLVGEGTGVEVPEGRVHELRLELAAAGLPRGGGVGFESFDKLKLGATDFEQRVLFRRALEGELGRTVGSLASVQSARVHLVLAEKSVFVGKSEPASASVVVKLRPGRTLAGGEIAGIVHLCASAVPGLLADRVALVTTDGAMLHRPKTEGGAAAGDADQWAATRTFEAALEERARTMLERVVGLGHADVRISAELDLARIERVADNFDNTKVALRSETKTVEQNGPGVDTVAGIPGAESNLPSGAGSATPATAGSASPGRLSLTRNWEISHVTEKRVTAGGALKRLTVAVMVDGIRHGDVTAARSGEELAKLTALVRGAVGFDEKRGDVLTLESVPFLAPETAQTPVEASTMRGAVTTYLWKLPRKFQIAIFGGVALVALVVGILLLRRVGRAVRSAATMVLARGPITEAEVVGGGRGASVGKRTTVEIVDYRGPAMDRASRDPATAALVLRGWLGTLEQKSSTPVSGS